MQTSWKVSLGLLMLLNLSSILDVGGKVMIGVVRTAWENNTSMNTSCYCFCLRRYDGVGVCIGGMEEG